MCDAMSGERHDEASRLGKLLRSRGWHLPSPSQCFSAGTPVGSAPEAPARPVRPMRCT